MIPKDPAMLLSYINTQLRDYYPSLEEFCKTFQVDEDTIVKTIASIDYFYDEKQNQFI